MRSGIVERSGPHRAFDRPPTPVPDHVEPEETPPPQDAREAIATLWEGRYNAQDIRELSAEMRKTLTAIAGHDEAIEWLKDIARKLPGALESIRTNISQLSTDVSNVAQSMRDATSSMSIQLRGHHERIEQVEERAASHEVRLDNIDAENLPPRVAALEEHHKTQHIEKRLVARQGRWRSRIIKGAVGAVVSLASALAGYLSS